MSNSWLLCLRVTTILFIYYYYVLNYFLTFLRGVVRLATSGRPRQTFPRFLPSHPLEYIFPSDERQRQQILKSKKLARN